MNGLNEAHSYPLRLVSGDQKEDYTIKNVSAVDGMDVPAVAEAIATCDIMATAVGVRILELIVPNIVAGIRRRWEIGGPALNIIICENLNNSNRIMEGMIKSLLNPEEVARFDETVGLVEAPSEEWCLFRQRRCVMVILCESVRNTMPSYRSIRLRSRVRFRK